MVLKKTTRKILIKLVIFFIVIILMFLVLLFLFAEVPDLNNSKERRVAQSTKIYDRTGKILLYDVHNEEKRTIIPFGEIPRHVKNATIALEDDSFYQHHGIRPLSFLRAIIINILKGGFEQGGSTITQQVVKNTILTKEKTVLRKLTEMIIAIKLERKHSKDEILNIYLNQIPYGSNAYGIEAAAETFFDKKANELTVKEAAFLAALPKAPTHYSPYGKYRKELEDRAEFTIKRMYDLGFLDKIEYEKAKKEIPVFSPTRIQGIIAPHFVFEVKEELAKKYGENEIESGGFKVFTTLDVNIQKTTEETIEKYAESNEKNFNATNESAVIINPKNGDVLAMVGSRNYFDSKNEGNFNVATSHRQPGSAFKPFVYATAFKKGFTPETVLFDLPTEFNPLCNADGFPTGGINQDKCYHPKNFDEKFRGPISLRESLAQSLNVPSVKTLYLAGLMDSISTARDFGITSLNDPERYGLTLVLGGGEISLLELTSAFGVFANDGVRNPYKMILKVEDGLGNNIYNTHSEPTEVIDKNIARSINSILSDNKSRGSSFGEALYFRNKQVAAKTGTTNDYRDAWVLGYTPEVVVGVWAGNNNNTPMEKKVAGFIVAPIWHEIMERLFIELPTSDFEEPNNLSEDKPWLRGEWRGGKEYVLDKISGKLATVNTPQELQEKRVIQEIHSILFWIDKKNDPQFKNWEEPIRKWAIQNKLYDQDESVIPKNTDDIHTPNNFPKIIKVDLLPEKQIYEKNEIIKITPKIESVFGVSQVDYFNEQSGVFLGSLKKQPFSFILDLNKIEDLSKIIKLKIKTYDIYQNYTEIIVNINIQE